MLNYNVHALGVYRSSLEVDGTVLKLSLTWCSLWRQLYLSNKLTVCRLLTIINRYRKFVEFLQRRNQFQHFEILRHALFRITWFDFLLWQFFSMLFVHAKNILGKNVCVTLVRLLVDEGGRDMSYASSTHLSSWETVADSLNTPNLKITFNIFPSKNYSWSETKFARNYGNSRNFCFRGFIRTIIRWLGPKNE